MSNILSLSQFLSEGINKDIMRDRTEKTLQHSRVSSQTDKFMENKAQEVKNVAKLAHISSLTMVFHLKQSQAGRGNQYRIMFQDNLL